MFDPYARFTENRLENNIPVYSLCLPDRPKQYVMFCLNVGNYHSQEHRGIAHMLEHVVAESAGAAALRNEARENGGKLLGGGGMTYNYWTCYGFALPGDNAVAIRSFIAKHRDYVLNNPLSYSVETEKEPFLVERQREFSIVDRAIKEWINYESISPGYWETPDIAFGTPESIRAFSQDELRQFYKTHYTPGNAFIISSGPLPEQEIMEMIKSTGWGDYTGGVKSLQPSEPYKVADPLLKSCAFEATSLSGATFGVTSLIPGGQCTKIDLVIFSRVALRHFQKILREQHKLVYNIDVDFFWRRDLQAISFDINGIQPENIDKIAEIFRETIENAPKEISTDKLEQARKECVFDVAYNELPVEQITRGAGIRLMDFGYVISNQEIIDNLRKVDLGRVVEFFSYMHPSRAMNSWMLPAGVKPPRGIPLYRLDQSSVDALRERRIPAEIGGDSLHPFKI